MSQCQSKILENERTFGDLSTGVSGNIMLCLDSFNPSREKVLAGIIGCLWSVFDLPNKNSVIALSLSSFSKRYLFLMDCQDV